MVGDAGSIPFVATQGSTFHATSLGISLSINRKNRVLRAPATTDSCDIGAGDPEGSPFAFWEPFRREDLNLTASLSCWREAGRWF